MWQFLHEAPAQRVLCENISDYSVKFYGHRWVENQDSPARAESLLDSYQNFITHICSLKKSEQPDSKIKSFARLKSIVHDTWLAARLKFFKMVAGKMNSVLRGFPKDAPMFLFMADTICDPFRFLDKNHLERCLKKCSSLYYLIQLNPLDKNIKKPPDSIDVRCEAKQNLEGVKLSTKKLEFKKGAQEFLAHHPSHLLKKSSLKYVIICSAVCLNPSYLENLAKRNYYQIHMRMSLQK